MSVHKKLVELELKNLDLLTQLNKSEIKINSLKKIISQIKKKVTFYIPTYNSDKTLEPCLNSVLNQSITPSEIIIVDANRHIEFSNNLIKKIKKNSEISVRIIHQDPTNPNIKKGLAAARNIAILNSKFDFIASCDSDVALDKHWLEYNLIHFFDNNIAGVCGNMHERKTNIFDKWRSIHMKQNWGNKQIINPPFLFGSNNIFRKKVLEQIKYNENFLTNYEDVDISNKIKKKGLKLIYEPKSKATHLRQDNLKSLLNSYYNWNFFSYPIPNNIFNLILKLCFFNVSKSIKLIINDILNLRTNLIFISLEIYFYNSNNDLIYFKNSIKGK
jgi:glycosyltransferase involved in cell wall biosynthesis